MVQRAMGHASAKVTLHTYGHLFPEADDRISQAMTAVGNESGL
jgi:integrase